jgi:hypothetical protein
MKTATSPRPLLGGPNNHWPWLIRKAGRRGSGWSRSRVDRLSWHLGDQSDVVMVNVAAKALVSLLLDKPTVACKPAVPPDRQTVPISPTGTSAGRFALRGSRPAPKSGNDLGTGRFDPRRRSGLGPWDLASPRPLSRRPRKCYGKCHSGCNEIPWTRLALRVVFILRSPFRFVKQARFRYVAQTIVRRVRSLTCGGTMWPWPPRVGGRFACSQSSASFVKWRRATDQPSASARCPAHR